MKYIRNLALAVGMAFSGCGEDTSSSGLEDQCNSDFDCKRDRVCESTYENGQEIRQCVSPNGDGVETPSIQEEVDLEDTTCEGSPLNGKYVQAQPYCDFTSVEPGNPETCRMEITFSDDGATGYLYYNNKGQIWLDRVIPDTYEKYGYQSDYLHRLTSSFDLNEVRLGAETDAYGEITCDMHGSMTDSVIERLWRKYQCILQQNQDVYGLRLEFIDGEHKGDIMVCLNTIHMNRLKTSNTRIPIPSEDECVEEEKAIRAACEQE